jgi:hypothetical protein
MAEQPRKTGVYDGGTASTTTKRGVPSWVWALVALALVGLIALWYANQTDDADDHATTPSTTQSTTTTTPATPPPAPAPPRQQ